jgi:hypothetical protein
LEVGLIQDSSKSRIGLVQRCEPQRKNIRSSKDKIFILTSAGCGLGSAPAMVPDEPNNIASEVAFLTSYKAKYITVSNIVEDGGGRDFTPGFAPWREIMDKAVH